MYFSEYSVKKAEEVLVVLKSTVHGLTDAEAEKRRFKFGLNEISGKEIKWWHILGRQFKDAFIYILFFAAILSFVMGEKIDAGLIVLFICIDVVLGFVQEFHSERSLQMLKNFVVTKARVVRAGKEKFVDSKELVPGDVIMVETGDIVPADARLFFTNDLSIDESVLTGESVPVNKNKESLIKEAKSVTQAVNMVFSRTIVVSGHGLAVVVGTGVNTVMGGVAKLTIETSRESTFEKGINKFSHFILKMILAILVVLFVANLLIKRDNANVFEFVLFTIALAVSVIPEALPVVTTLSLSRGSLRLAHKKVVVRRLSAVEDLGSVEVLCTDKTGTITENKLAVEKIMAPDKEKCLYYAALGSSFLGEGKREPNNAFDLAIWNKLSDKEHRLVQAHERLDEIPFNPHRRRNSVLLKAAHNNILVVRGAVESVLTLCKDLSLEEKTKAKNWAAQEGKDGKRAIVVAIKKINNQPDYSEADESDLILAGIITFVDPIKSSATAAIKKAEELGVKIKILTGDSREVAGAVAQKVKIIDDPSEVLSGEDLEKMNDAEKNQAVNKYAVFARVSPEQKYQIIEILQKKYEVGFLGEGINDAPALKLANVALVVDGASDIAREAADIVLLNKSLSVIIDGIQGGREVYANTVKYLKTTLISNFGNFYAIAIASLIITFLPMLPTQILLLNLLSDFPMIAIALDTVDLSELRRPRAYNVREVVMMAILLGVVSTVFDFIFFALFYKHEPSVLQTNWFMGSVLTELALIYSVRTHGLFIRAHAPSRVLVWLSVVAVVATVALPFTEVGQIFFKFVAPTASHLLIIFGVIVCYFAFTESLKLVYYRFFNQVN